MALSLNEAKLIGNVGKDPEIKYTPSGIAVAKISVATNEKWKNKDGEWVEHTEWHRVTLWKRLAEIAGEYVKKGSKVYVSGKLKTSEWTDRESGKTMYGTEIVADHIILLDKKGEQRTIAEEDVPPSRGEITEEDIPF